MPNFHLESRLRTMPDIQRDFMFEISIPEISKIVSSIKDEEQFIIRAKTASIPDKSNTPIESYFMSMTQFYPGRNTFSSTLNIDFEETEDQFVTKALYDWQNVIMNTKESDNDSGHSMGKSKRDGQSTHLYIKMYKYNGEPMENMIKCFNAWPNSVGESPLSMNSNSAVFRNCIFTFDFWNLIKS
jgi:hypothetical protein